MFHISPLQTSFVVCFIYQKTPFFMTWTCHKMRALNSERDTATGSSKSPINKMVFRTCTFWSPFFLSLFIINNSYTLFKDLFSLKIEKLNKLNLPTQFPFPHHYTKPSLNALHGCPAKSQSQMPDSWHRKDPFGHPFRGLCCLLFTLKLNEVFRYFIWWMIWSFKTNARHRFSVGISKKE